MTSRPDVDLKRQIGLFAATSITVGNIVGSGIFRSPHSVAQQLDTLALVLLAWVVGGVLSICGSLVLAELAVARPRTGGLYVFIRDAFGDAWAFVFGWASIWVIKPTVIASIVSVFALYFCDALGMPAATHLWVGIGAVLLLTFVNWLGVREGTRTQELFTTAKMVGIVALVVAAFSLPHAGPSEILVAPEAHPSLMVAFALAMIPVLFAYDGWTDSTYVGGEVVNPSRTLPIAIIGGTLIVIATYVLVNLAYYHVLLPAEVARYEAVGSETIGRILGDGGRTALAVLVAVSTFGTTNGAILTGPRVTLAMAANGLLWKPLARVNVQRSSPGPALWLQAVLACVWLAFAGGFEDASGWFVTTSWLFYGLTTAAVFVLRRREGAPAGYRTPLYPLTPLLFILVTVALIASDFADQGIRAAAGVIIAALGFPVYYLWKGRRAAAAR
jgi:APA family basic amino acid/polyamine antiporter